MPWNDAGRIRLVGWEIGGSDAVIDGWVHRKTVPHAILSQVLAGSYRLSGGGRSTRIAPGELAVVAASKPVVFAHHHDRSGRMAYRYLHVASLLDGIIDPLALHETPTRLSGPAAQRVGILIGRLHGPEGRDPALGPALVQTALAEVLAALPPSDDAAVRLTAAGALAPMIAWIRAHLADPITVDGMARICGLSRSRLHAVCKVRLGKSPLAVVRELRLDAAAHLLLVTDRPMSAIAEACGFADASHLSHVFRRRHAMSPLLYRSTQRLPAQREF